MSAVTRKQTSVKFDIVPRTLLHKSAEFLETRELLAFARVKKMLKGDLYDHPSSAQLFKGCAIREYPLLARDLPFLLAQEYPDLPEAKRLAGMNVVRLFWKIDAYIKNGFFLPKQVKTGPYNHKHPQKIAFHGSAMFQVVNGNQIQKVDIRCKNPPLNFQKLKNFSFFQFPDCLGSGAMAVNDKYVAINRITERPNVQVDQPAGGKKISVGGRSRVIFFDSTTGECAGELYYKPAVSCLCFDPCGDLIIGDHRRGVFKLKFTPEEPSLQKREGSSDVPRMVLLRDEIIIECSPQEIAITALTATSNELLIGEEIGNVIRYNRKTKAKTEVHVGSSAVTKIVEKPSGELMFLSHRGRVLSEINRASQSVSVFTPLHNDIHTQSSKAFCLSDKSMFMVVDGKLRVSRPFDFTTASSFAGAPSLMIRHTNSVIPLYCDGARLVHHFTEDQRNQAGFQFRIYDFSIDASKILTRLKESRDLNPDSSTAKKNYEDFKARVAKDKGDQKEEMSKSGSGKKN